VIGHCAPSTGIEPLTALAATAMTREPYASARRVFRVVDNGASTGASAAMTPASSLHRIAA